MSVTVSLAKAGAVASTALLMGAYVWFQGRGGGPEVLADTTTGQAVSRPVGSQPETLPGSKSALTDLMSLVDMIDGKPAVFPGSKDAPIFTPGTVVFPGSKSDGVFDPKQLEERVQSILPGSKSSMVEILPKDGGKQDGSRPPKPAAPPAILSGSKSRAPLIPSKILVPARASTNTPGEKKKPTAKPGSKPSFVPVLPPTQPRTIPNPPNANEKNPKEQATPPTKPTVLPGSKSISGILDRETIERALERTRKSDQEQAPAPQQRQK